MKLYFIIFFVFCSFSVANAQSEQKNDMHIKHSSKIILKQNTKFGFLGDLRLLIFANKHFNLKIEGEFIEERILNSDNDTIIKNFDIKIFDKDHQYFLSCKSFNYTFFWDSEKMERYAEKKVKKVREIKIKKHKNYIKIIYPIRTYKVEYLSYFKQNFVSGCELNLNRGKYYITVEYKENSTTYHSDTIPLYVR